MESRKCSRVEPRSIVLSNIFCFSCKCAKKFPTAWKILVNLWNKIVSYLPINCCAAHVHVVKTGKFLVIIE